MPYLNPGWNISLESPLETSFGIEFTALMCLFGGVFNIYLIYETMNHRIIQKWFKSQMVFHDLRLFIVAMPWLNLFFFFSVIIKMIMTEMMKTTVRNDDDFVSCYKFKFDMICKYGVICGQFFISRTALKVTQKGVLTVTDRFETTVEFGFSLMLFLICLRLLAYYDIYDSNFYPCDFEQRRQLIENILFILPLVFILIVSIISIRRSNINQIHDPGIVNLSWKIGFLFVDCWLPLSFLYIFDYYRPTILRELYFLLDILRLLPCVLYPYFCLQERTHLFTDKGVDFSIHYRKRTSSLSQEDQSAVSIDMNKKEIENTKRFDLKK